MVEKSVKLSSKNITPVEIISKVSTSRLLKGDLEEDLSDVSDTEVAGYLNTKKDFLLKKLAWEMMNPDYKKGKQSKPNTSKRKYPINKIVPSKKTSIIRSENCSQSENKKRLSSEINYDALEKLFHEENSPKKAKLDKHVVLGDQMKDSHQSIEERVLEEEEEEPDWNEDYTNEDAYGDEDEGEDNEEIIW